LNFLIKIKRSGFMLIGENSKLVCIGDSITDAGRNYNAEEGFGDYLGYGYVARINDFLASAYPERSIRVINKGINGNTVRDLKSRWQKDVIDLKPDWLMVMIGVNDAWRHYDTPFIPENRVYEDEYESTYREIISQVRPALKGLIIVSPYMVERNRSDEMFARVLRHAEISRRIAKDFDGIYADVQKAIDKFTEVRYSAAISLDRVHPNSIGAMLIAREILNSVKFDWEK